MCRDLFWCHEVGCGVRWNNLVACKVAWCTLSGRDVNWCNAFFLMLCYITLCNVLSCDALPCDQTKCAAQYAKQLVHCHASSPSHMQRHLQCAEKHWFPSNTTKYCACHEIQSSRCQRKIPQLLPPKKKSRIIRPWNRYFAPAATKSCTCHEKWYCIFTKYCNVIYNARSNRSHPPTAPNTAPATQTHFHNKSSSYIYRYL